MLYDACDMPGTPPRCSCVLTHLIIPTYTSTFFPCGTSGKESTYCFRRWQEMQVCSLGQEDLKEMAIQCSCLENSMNRGAWWSTVHGAAESDTTKT